MRSSNAMLSALWGNVSPAVKAAAYTHAEHIPPRAWNTFPMAKALAKPIPPRTRLAANLKVALERSQMSAPELAELAKVDRKTVNNLLNARFDPRLSLVEKIANALGLTTWQHPRRAHYAPDTGPGRCPTEAPTPRTKVGHPGRADAQHSGLHIHAPGPSPKLTRDLQAPQSGTTKGPFTRRLAS